MAPPAFVDVLEQHVQRSRRNPKQLADLTGLPVETIKNWLEGRVRRPRDWRDIVKLARILHLSEDEASGLLRAAGHAPVAELARRTQNDPDRQLLATWANAQPERPAPTTEPAAGGLPVDRIPDPAPIPLGSRMLLRRNPLFVGRDTALLAVARSLASGKGGRLTAITGIGGIGKTQLTAEFVHRYSCYFPGGVYWLSFADAQAVPGEVAACGEADVLALGSDYARLPLSEKIAMVRAAWRHPVPRLLIFDNCEDAALLAEWLPASGSSRVLLTSRRAEWPPELGIDSIALDVLQREESVALLLRHRPDLATDDPYLAAIAAELGDLPLALHVAGSYLARYRHVAGPAAYLAELRHNPPLQHTSLATNAVSPTGHDLHVERTFALSYERLDRRSPVDDLARTILARVACVAPGVSVPRALLDLMTPQHDGSAAPQIMLAEALNRLNDLGLISVDPGGIRIHRLIIAFVQQHTHDDALHTAAAAVLRYTSGLIDDSEIRSMLAVQPHIHHIADTAFAQGAPCSADLADAFGYLLWINCNHRAAQQYLERALALRRQDSRSNPLSVAENHSLLGLVFQTQSRLERARVMFEHAIATWESAVGPDDPRTVDDIHNLGYLCILQARFGEAEALLRRAMYARRRIHGLGHRQMVRSLNGLGYLFLKRGRPRTAARYLELAYRISGRLQPAQHRTTALTLLFMAEARLALADGNSCETLLQQSAEMWEALFGPQHNGLAETQYMRGRLFQSRGQTDAALAELKRSLAMAIRVLGERARDVVYVRTALGSVLRSGGQLEEARLQLEQALAISLDVVGAEHPDTATVLDELGLFALAAGNTAAARVLFERAFLVRSTTLSDDHPAWARSLRHLQLCGSSLAEQLGDETRLPHGRKPDSRARQGQVEPLAQLAT